MAGIRLHARDTGQPSELADSMLQALEASLYAFVRETSRSTGQEGAAAQATKILLARFGMRSIAVRHEDYPTRIREAQAALLTGSRPPP
jgi:hypothetical protein